VHQQRETAATAAANAASAERDDAGVLRGLLEEARSLEQQADDAQDQAEIANRMGDE
jgi:hypothetical protein